MLLENIKDFMRACAYLAMGGTLLLLAVIAAPNFIDSVRSFHDEPECPHSGFMPECEEYENTLPPVVALDERGEE